MQQPHLSDMFKKQMHAFYFSDFIVFIDYIMFKNKGDYRPYKVQLTCLINY